MNAGEKEMLGKEDSGIGFRTFFGPNASTATVFSSSPNMFTVTGSDGHDGVYWRSGNLISGPDGTRTVMGKGPVKTIIGPDGVHTVIENGFGGGAVL